MMLKSQMHNMVTIGLSKLVQRFKHEYQWYRLEMQFCAVGDIDDDDGGDDDGDDDDNDNQDCKSFVNLL